MIIKVRTVVLTLLFLFVSILEVALRRGIGTHLYFGLDLQVLLKFGSYTAAFLVFLLCLPHIRTPKAIILPTLYVVYALMSCSYSPDVNLSLSQVYVLFAQLAIATLVATVAADRDTRNAVWNVFLCAILTKVTVSYLAYMAGVELLNPRTLGPYGARLHSVARFGGLLGSPNAMGHTCAIGALICFVMFRTWTGRRRQLYLVGGIVCFVGLLTTQSRTALLSLVAACIAVMYARNWRAAVAAALVLSIVVAGIWFWDRQLAVEVTARGQSEEELTTLQGRTLIWTVAWRLIKMSPWIGHGYAASRVILPRDYDMPRMHDVNQTHNMWLETMLTLGIAGTAFLALTVLANIVMHARALRRRGVTAPSDLVGWGIVWMSLITGIAEPSLASPQNIVTTAFLVAYALRARPEEVRSVATASTESPEVEAQGPQIGLPGRSSA